jgi:hypothetical protein
MNSIRPIAKKFCAVTSSAQYGPVEIAGLRESVLHRQSDQISPNGIVMHDRGSSSHQGAMVPIEVEVRATETETGRTVEGSVTKRQVREADQGA